MSQFSIPCVVYRGGTSRGIFFNKKDLPEDVELQKKIFLHGIDAYNVSQVNGLGSGTSHTSKVCVVSPSTIEGADVDYTFYQIGIGQEIVDDKGTCGNLMAAIGAYAVDEGMVDINPNAEAMDISVFNTNIKKLLKINVPIINRKARVSGDYRMPGVNGTGAKFTVNILNPGGGKTGRTLPVGLKYTISTKKKTYTVSFVDVVNPFVFIAASDLGIKGTELNSELINNKELNDEIEEIRLGMAVASGMYKTVEEAERTPSVPKIAVVTEPQDYVTPDGTVIKADEVDLVAKMLSMGKFHRTFAGSGLYCIASAALLPDTIPNQYSRKKSCKGMHTIRIGHPEGVAEVNASLTEDGKDILSVGLDRTIRRIIKGDLYIPE